MKIVPQLMEGFHVRYHPNQQYLECHFDISKIIFQDTRISNTKKNVLVTTRVTTANIIREEHYLTAGIHSYGTLQSYILKCTPAGYISKFAFTTLVWSAGFVVIHCRALSQFKTSSPSALCLNLSTSSLNSFVERFDTELDILR